MKDLHILITTKLDETLSAAKINAQLKSPEFLSKINKIQISAELGSNELANIKKQMDTIQKQLQASGKGVKIIDDEEAIRNINKAKKGVLQLYDSIDSAAKKFSKFGTVKTDKMFDPVTKELKGFNLEIKKSDGLVERLKFKMVKLKELDGKSAFEQVSRKQTDKVEETILKQNQKINKQREQQDKQETARLRKLVEERKKLRKELEGINRGGNISSDEYSKINRNINNPKTMKEAEDALKRLKQREEERISVQKNLRNEEKKTYQQSMKSLEDQRKLGQLMANDTEKIIKDKKRISNSIKELERTGNVSKKSIQSLNNELAKVSNQQGVNRVVQQYTRLSNQAKNAEKMATQVNQRLKEQEKEQRRLANLGQKKGGTVNASAFTGNYDQAKAKLEQYVKSVYGANAKIDELRRHTDAAGKETWKFSTRVQNSDKSITTYRGNIDRTSRSLHQVSQRTQEASRNNITMMAAMKTALQKFPIWIKCCPE